MRAALNPLLPIPANPTLLNWGPHQKPGSPTVPAFTFSGVFNQRSLRRFRYRTQPVRLFCTPPDSSQSVFRFQHPFASSGRQSEAWQDTPYLSWRRQQASTEETTFSPLPALPSGHRHST